MSGNIELLYSFVGFLILTLVYVFTQKEDGEDQTQKPAQKGTAKKDRLEISKPPGKSWAERLKEGLTKSRQEVWGKVLDVLSSDSSDKYEQVEELLYSADISSRVISELLEKLASAKVDFSDKSAGLKFVKDFLRNKMTEGVQTANTKVPGTKVVMIVGINGVGKTTTIGKLATRFKNEGKKVVVGACDTFRAAAVEQLEVWCKRADVEMVRAPENADPSGVAYDTVQKAKDLGADICLVDTAGRIHTKSNLMDELAKTKKVMGKVIPDAPHEVYLVVDAISGQNALKQAEQFNEKLSLTGLIMTKCDGSAKAGSAVGIVSSLKVPVRYIGVGETVEDLNDFDLALYLDSLVG